MATFARRCTTDTWLIGCGFRSDVVFVRGQIVGRYAEIALSPDMAAPT